jgi:hypothetical protein
MGINLEFAHNMWLERNKSEHDQEGQPENRKKEKLVEIIGGKYRKVEDLYNADKMEVECLTVISVANSQMMEKIEKMKRQEVRRIKEIDYYRYDIVGGDYPAMGNPGEHANLHPPVWSGRF